jgi:hypothetical protein
LAIKEEERVYVLHYGSRTMVTLSASLIRVASAALTIATAAACGSTPVEPTEPDFTGTAASLQRQTDVVTVRLTQLQPPRAGYTERVVHIHPSTIMVIRQRDGSYRAATADEIVIGAILRVKTTGVEYRSDPPQYDATWVELILPLPD